MLKRSALLALVLSTVAIGSAYASAFTRGGAPAWAAWALAIGTTSCMTSITLLAVASGAGARRRGAPLVTVVVALLAVWMLVALCFALALLLPAESAREPQLVLGLPRRAAILMYGVGLVPLFILPLAYASSFDALTLPEEELQRIRAAAARSKHASPDREVAA